MPVSAGPEVANLPFGWGAIFALLNLLLGGGAVVAWIKQRAGYRKVDVDADEKLRSEMWRDIEALKASKEDTSRRLTMAETKIASQTVQIGQLRFISALLVDELERIDPRNSIARQARLLLDHIQPDAMPAAEEVGSMAEVLARMKKIEGVNE